MTEPYDLEKSVWTDADFDRMGWHDATIHAIGGGEFAHVLHLDVDYIFRWVHPGPGGSHFKFYVAPCTIEFENVYDLQLDVDSFQLQLEIDTLRREDPRRPKNAEDVGRDVEWLWRFELHSGELSFRSIGFTQYVRALPMLVDSYTLDLDRRGGISFDRRAVQIDGAR